MLYIDTDSLILQFFMHDLFKELPDVLHMRGLFDFGEIPANNLSHLNFPDDPNKGKVRFFKDETKDHQQNQRICIKVSNDKTKSRGISISSYVPWSTRSGLKLGAAIA